MIFSGKNFRLNLIFFLILGAALIAAYMPAANAPFVLDDPRVVERSSQLNDISNFFSITALFADRPLVNFTFALNRLANGTDVRGYHGVNLAFHMANVFLVWALAILVLKSAPDQDGQKQGKNPSFGNIAPFFAAALFALHPIQSQPVIYISQRATLMACFFYLLAVICFIVARRGQEYNKNVLYSFPLFVMCAIFGIMAFLSKQNAVSLPIAILMAELVLFNGQPGLQKKRILVISGLAVILILGFAWLGGAFNGELSTFVYRLDQLTRETQDVGRWQYLCTQFTVIVLYIRLILFPAGLNIDHGYGMKNEFFQDATPIAFVFLAGVIILTFMYTKRYKMAGFGILWFFIGLSLESSILPIRDAMFEHRVYLAFPGICIAAGYLVSRIKLKFFHAGLAVSAAILTALAISTFLRAQVWQSEISLWGDSVKKAPHNARAWNNYGNALIKKGYKNRAIFAYQEAIKLNSGSANPYCNLGKIHAQNKALDMAESLFLKSIEIEPGLAEAHNNLAIVYMSKGQREKGIAHFQEAINLDRQRPFTHYNLGKALLDSGKPKKALEHFMKAIAMKPEINPMAYYLAAAAWALEGDPENAAKWAHKAMVKGLDNSLEFIQKDPRFKKQRQQIVNLLKGMKIKP